jgi:hypothetical protein
MENETLLFNLTHSNEECSILVAMDLAIQINSGLPIRNRCLAFIDSQRSRAGFKGMMANANLMKIEVDGRWKNAVTGKEHHMFALSGRDEGWETFQ